MMMLSEVIRILKWVTAAWLLAAPSFLVDEAGD